MAVTTLGVVYNNVRGLLSDTQVAGGELFTNNYFVNNPNAFGEPYRTMFARMIGPKRAQRVVYIILPAMTSVVIPSTYNIVDFSEPEMIEERSAPNSITVTSTDTSTPIRVTAPGHGLTSNAEGAISGVSGTSSPWGNWFITVIDSNTFSLNGSASDGVAGTGGFFYPATTAQFSEVDPVDLTAGGLDGQPQSTLGYYLWINEMLQFRGATNPVQLRITYYCSGTAPTDPNYTINIDNCLDFLSVATAANCARAKTWYSIADRLRNQAYGDPSHPEEPALIDLFFNAQVMSLQRGPVRRQQPFRSRRSKFGTYLLG